MQQQDFGRIQIRVMAQPLHTSTHTNEFFFHEAVGSYLRNYHNCLSKIIPQSFFEFFNFHICFTSLPYLPGCAFSISLKQVVLGTYQSIFFRYQIINTASQSSMNLLIKLILITRIFAIDCFLKEPQFYAYILLLFTFSNCVSEASQQNEAHW